MGSALVTGIFPNQCLPLGVRMSLQVGAGANNGLPCRSSSSPASWPRHPALGLRPLPAVAGEEGLEFSPSRRTAPPVRAAGTILFATSSRVGEASIGATPGIPMSPHTHVWIAVATR